MGKRKMEFTYCFAIASWSIFVGLDDGFKQLELIPICKDDSNDVGRFDVVTSNVKTNSIFKQCMQFLPHTNFCLKNNLVPREKYNHIWLTKFINWHSGCRLHGEENVTYVNPELPNALFPSDVTDDGIVNENGGGDATVFVK